MRIIVLLIICQFLICCAGTQTHIHMLEDGGAIRIENVTDENYNYKVFIKNTVDFGWDGGRKEDREKATSLIFESRCQKVEILEETPLQTGTYAFGKPAITWIMKVKCSKKTE